MINVKEEHVLKSSWRPAMAWSYFAICLWDFLVAPIFIAWYSSRFGVPYQPWKPITLGEGGMYHIAMGAILGVAAWTRGQEKIARIETSSYVREERRIDTSEDEPTRPPLSYDK
jgi:hypothetical protein